MKIQLSSTLAFTPRQLDARQVGGRRATGQLFGVCSGREYRLAVFDFRHDDNDKCYYLVDPGARVWMDELASNDTLTQATSSATGDDAALVWIDHDDAMSYKPYSFLVVNAISLLLGDWDGVVYQTPRGERLRETVMNATLQVVDACVCNRFGLWAQVRLASDRVAPELTLASPVSVGWVPLTASAR